MFSYVSGDKHIEIKTPTHQISTKSHGAHEKNQIIKCSSVQGKKDRRGLSAWGVWGDDRIVETEKDCV